MAKNSAIASEDLDYGAALLNKFILNLPSDEVGLGREHFTKLMEEVRLGNLSQLENTLVMQFSTLNSLYLHLIAMGSTILSQGTSIKTLQRVETLMRLGLKAQEQSRKTINSLAELKNPKRATFIKQQVNQVAIRQDGAIAHPSQEPRSIQELEASPYATMDTRSEAATEGTDPQLATVAVEYGPHNGGGEAAIGAELS